jgi:hypothetical protein
MNRIFASMLTKLSNKVLNLEDLRTPKELEPLLEYRAVNLCSKNLDDFLLKLRKKHLVNHIIITDLEGIVIASTEKDLKEGFKSAAMYNYINTEIKDLSIILIESKGWNIIFKYSDKVYFIKANDSLSRTEVYAIVNDLENYLKVIK